MSTNLSLDLELRSVTGKEVKYLRTAGILPAVVYGKGVGPFSVQVDEKVFFNVYRKAGRSTLVELTIPGQPKQSAYIQDIQRHPVSRSITHADFRVVDLKVAITADIPIHISGTAEPVEKGDAVVNQALSQISVHGLPGDLPSYIDVDISPLDSTDKSILVSDLETGGKFEVLTDPEEVVVTLTETRMAKELEAEEAEAEEAAPSEPELIREERKEEDEEEE